MCNPLCPRPSNLEVTGDIVPATLDFFNSKTSISTQDNMLLSKVDFAKETRAPKFEGNQF